jgi:hypothetical protein
MAYDAIAAENSRAANPKVAKLKFTKTLNG